MRPFILFIGGILLAASVLFITVMTGVLFYAWPTFTNDQQLNVTEDVLGKLKELRTKDKFAPDDFYTGANIEDKDQLDLALASLLNDLIANLPKHPKRSYVLSKIKHVLPPLRLMDTEDRERACNYFLETMKIVGISDPGELLNVFMYGWPVNWFLKAR